MVGDWREYERHRPPSTCVHAPNGNTAPVQSTTRLRTSLLRDGRLRRDRRADSFADRCTKVQSGLSTVLSTLRTTRDLAVLRAIGIEHLQRQSNRRPLSMYQRRLSVVPPLRPRGSATLNATTRRRNLALQSHGVLSADPPTRPTHRGPPGPLLILGDHDAKENFEGQSAETTF